MSVSQIEQFLQPDQRSGEVRRSSDPSPAPERRAPKGIRILVVDDSEVNLNLMRSTLEPLGYEVLAANAPADAIGLARRHLPDLIVSDPHMPQQCGWELLRAVKMDPELRAIPFLLYSSSDADMADYEHAMALGAERCVFRPIRPEALLAEIESCLSKDYKD